MRSVIHVLLCVGALVGCLPAFDDQCERDGDCAEGMCRSGLCVVAAAVDAEPARTDAAALDADAMPAPDDGGARDDAAVLDDVGGRRDAVPPADAGLALDAAAQVDQGPAEDAAVGEDAARPDAAVEPDAAAAEDAARPDAAVDPDAASDPDAAVEPDAAVDPDAAVEPDAAVDPDADVDRDAAPDPDAAALVDAQPPVDVAVASDVAVDPDAAPDPDAGSECDPGQARSCGPGGACIGGFQFCVDGRWGPCEGSGEPSPERCNAFDDDCDGATDEALTRACGSDVGLCELGVETCHFGAWGPCLGGVNPVFVERCDGLDQDCDGEVDEAPDGGPLSCPVPHGAGVCEAAQCVDFQCDPGWLNTDGGREDGCEHGCGPPVAGQLAGGLAAPVELAAARSADHTLVAWLDTPDASDEGALRVALDGVLLDWGGAEGRVYHKVVAARVGATFLVAAITFGDEARGGVGGLTLIRVAAAGGEPPVVEVRQQALAVSGPPAIGVRAGGNDGASEALVVFEGVPPSAVNEILPPPRLLGLRIDLTAPLADAAFEVIDAPLVAQTDRWGRAAVVALADDFLVFAEHMEVQGRQVLLEAYVREHDGWTSTGHVSAGGPPLLDAPIVARRGDVVVIASRWNRAAQLRVLVYRRQGGFGDARLFDADAGSSPPALYATDDGFVLLGGGPTRLLARFLAADGLPRTEATVAAVVTPEADDALYDLRVDAMDGTPRALWRVGTAADADELRAATLECR